MRGPRITETSHLRAPQILLAGALQIIELFPDSFVSGGPRRSRLKRYLEDRHEAMEELRLLRSVITTPGAAARIDSRPSKARKRSHESG